MEQAADIIIVGAGISGIAAAHELQKRGYSVLILEASHRVGGRAYTSRDTGFSTPTDLGCRWFQNTDDNPLIGIAESLGFKPQKELGGEYYVQGKHWLGEEDAEDARDHIHKNWQRVADFSEEFDPVAAKTLSSTGRWQGLFRYLFAVNTGRDVEEASTQDLNRYEDNGESWFLDGMGTFIEKWSEGLPVQFNSPVKNISTRPYGILVEGKDFELRANAAVITVSAGVMKDQVISFSPPLPEWKQEAFEHITMGHLEIFGIEFAEKILDVEPNSYVYVQNADSSAMEFYLRPDGKEIALGFIGGKQGQALLDQGENAMVEFGLKQLGKIYEMDLSPFVHSTFQTAWGKDPWIRGALSAAVPGGAEYRPDLAEPVRDRIFFAGEATSVTGFSSMHGAYSSGIRCVDQIEELEIPKSKG